MARRKLKSSRDYGQISPPFMDAVYHQDGVYFDARGLEIFTDGDKTDGDRQKSIETWKAKEDQAASMRAAKASATSEQEPSNPSSAKDQPDAEITPDLAVSNNPEDANAPAAADIDDEHTPPDTVEPPDLRKWAMGEQKLKWFEVRAMISKKYHFDATNKLAAIQKLIEKGIVTAEEAQPDG